jgi:predicted DNA-binding transcriptional regulator YafY
MMRSKRVKIELTSDEALVLHDWLTRFNQRADADFADQAEERVLFDLEAMLEKALEAPLQSDYADLLAQARSNMRDECS